MFVRCYSTYTQNISIYGTGNSSVSFRFCAPPLSTDFMKEIQKKTPHPNVHIVQCTYALTKYPRTEIRFTAKNRKEIA